MKDQICIYSSSGYKHASVVVSATRRSRDIKIPFCLSAPVQKRKRKFSVRGNYCSKFKKKKKKRKLKTKNLSKITTYIR